MADKTARQGRFCTSRQRNRGFTSVFCLHNSDFAFALWHKQEKAYTPWRDQFLKHETLVNIDENGCRWRSCQICIFDNHPKRSGFNAKGNGAKTKPIGDPQQKVTKATKEEEDCVV
jgi:hypothetical protein